MKARILPAAASLGAGAAMALALPPWGWWPLAFVGLVGLDRLIADRPVRQRFARAWLAGVGLYIPSFLWMQDMTVPGYVIASLGYSAWLGVAVSIVPARAPGRWFALPGAIALLELLRWSWPFGGVPLSSLAISQVASPLAPVLRIGGAMLLVVVSVVVGVGLAALLSRRWRAAAVAALVVAVAVAGSAFAPSGRQTGTLDVATVQGGGPQGTRADDTDSREVFERHLAASELIDGPVDLVLWPEDVVTTEGPVGDNAEGAQLADLARQLDAPLIAGVVEGVDRETFRNASIAYDAAGEEIDAYEKVHRVPFGEYVPLRSLVEPFGGADLTVREAGIGDGPAELRTPAGHLSIAISWEIFFGDRVREGVGNGAEIVLNPTNGSSFLGTMVQGQQVASSRMRAIESGRWVVQAAPTGFSAIVAPDGTVIEQTGVSERAVLQGTVGLRDGQTIYTRVGLLPGWLAALTALGLGWAAAWSIRRRDEPAPVGAPASTVADETRAPQADASPSGDGDGQERDAPRPTGTPLTSSDLS